MKQLPGEYRPRKLGELMLSEKGLYYSGATTDRPRYVRVLDPSGLKKGGGKAFADFAKGIPLKRR